ncbi:MAG: helix-turn-helix transcriptional regulator [Bacteroidetes bacterium]|nr:helix-turn-helix transcriptional regulator [Bacteroidota bacterium]
MGVNVYDETGFKYVINDSIDLATINRPVVTELREKHSFFFGDAELVQLAFSGIYIVYGDMLMREQRLLRFDFLNQQHLVELHFALSGAGTMYNRISGNRYDFLPNQTNMHYTPAFSGVGSFTQNEAYRFFEVHFTTDFFFELAKDSSPLLMSFADTIMKGQREISRENIPITLAMHQCIREIMNCKVTGGLKLLFLQSKSIELLALQAQAYEEAAANKHLVCKSGYDKERIHYAREYLLLHAQNPPSLSELAKVAGINEFKLKQGFKAVFDNTVFGYLSDYRLGQARDLLLEKKSIKEVADELGYSSVQHFSTAFKKKYGVTPGKMR